MRYLNLLTVILVLLKLLDVITLSWWKVFIPTYTWTGYVLLILTMLMSIELIHYKKYGRWIDD